MAPMDRPSPVSAAARQRRPAATSPLNMPQPVQRQTNAPLITELTPDGEYDVEAGLAAPDREEEEPPTMLQKKEDPAEALHMFLQGQIMAKSTALTELNGQLQRLQTEILERQNLMNEVKSRMLNLQGGVGMAHEVVKAMKELRGEKDEATDGK